MRKVLLIGAINENHPPMGGEEYKNKILQKYLSDIYDLRVIDTHKWKKRPEIIIKIAFSLLFKNWDCILISASSFSVYRLTKLLNFIKKNREKSIYLVIGGYFPLAVQSGVFKKEPYERLKAVVLEGELLKTTLIEAGFKGNALVLPNFKDFPTYLPNLKNNISYNTRFLFISRIQPAKGVELIFEAVKLLHKQGIDNFTVTFFGPVDPEYSTLFFKQLTQSLTYGGFLDIIKSPGSSYKRLSTYDVMLFPTFWQGEGFPGAIVDAFVSGLPVIASDWNMNRELVIDGKNGILIPPNDAGALAQAMKQFIENKALRLEMGRSSLEMAPAYHVNSVMLRLQKIIEE